MVNKIFKKAGVLRCHKRSIQTEEFRIGCRREFNPNSILYHYCGKTNGDNICGKCGS